MKFALLLLVSLGLLACGGEMEAELGSTTQATTGSSNSGPALAPIYTDASGVIGTGLFVGTHKVLISRFHDNFSHWPAFGVKVYDRYNNKTYSLGSCSEPFGVGPWSVCTMLRAPGPNPIYFSDWTYSYPDSTVYAHGAGQTCTSGSMSTNYTQWVFDSDHTVATYTTVGGIRNVGSNNLCTASGFASFCYDFNTGSTCMWGDDGAPQFKYNAYLVGQGFGNAGAAWANSYVINWIDAHTP